MKIGDEIRFEYSPGVLITGKIKTIMSNGNIVITVKSPWSGLGQDYILGPHSLSQEKAK